MDCQHLLKCHGAFFEEGSVRLLFEYMDLGCLETLMDCWIQYPEKLNN